MIKYNRPPTDENQVDWASPKLWAAIYGVAAIMAAIVIGLSYLGS